MSIMRKVHQMSFVGINTNSYRYEPDIEFNMGNGYNHQYTHEDFVEAIRSCNKFGVACKNLTDHLPEFERELALFNKMQPEQQLPPAM